MTGALSSTAGGHVSKDRSRPYQSEPQDLAQGQKPGVVRRAPVSKTTAGVRGPQTLPRLHISGGNRTRPAALHDRTGRWRMEVWQAGCRRVNASVRDWRTEAPRENGAKVVGWEAAPPLSACFKAVYWFKPSCSFLCPRFSYSCDQPARSCSRLPARSRCLESGHVSFRLVGTVADSGTPRGRRR